MPCLLDWLFMFCPYRLLSTMPHIWDPRRNYSPSCRRQVSITLCFLWRQVIARHSSGLTFADIFCHPYDLPPFNGGSRSSWFSRIEPKPSCVLSSLIRTHIIIAALPLYVLKNVFDVFGFNVPATPECPDFRGCTSQLASTGKDSQGIDHQYPHRLKRRSSVSHPRNLPSSSSKPQRGSTLANSPYLSQDIGAPLVTPFSFHSDVRGHQHAISTADTSVNIYKVIFPSGVPSCTTPQETLSARKPTMPVDESLGTSEFCGFCTCNEHYIISENYTTHCRHSN